MADLYDRHERFTRMVNSLYEEALHDLNEKGSKRSRRSALTLKKKAKLQDIARACHGVLKFQPLLAENLTRAQLESMFVPPPLFHCWIKWMIYALRLGTTHMPSVTLLANQLLANALKHASAKKMNRVNICFVLVS